MKQDNVSTAYEAGIPDAKRAEDARGVIPEGKIVARLEVERWQPSGQ